MNSRRMRRTRHLQWLPSMRRGVRSVLHLVDLTPRGLIVQVVRISHQARITHPKALLYCPVTHGRKPSPAPRAINACSSMVRTIRGGCRCANLEDEVGAAGGVEVRDEGRRIRRSMGRLGVPAESQMP